MARCNVLLFIVVAWAGVQFCNGMMARPRTASISMGTGVAINKTISGEKFNNAFVYNSEVLYGADWVGRGACGTRLNHQKDSYAAISSAWFTSRDPRRDQYCKNVFVHAGYPAGNAIVVPVRHWFNGDRAILVLSQPAYQKLNPKADDVYFQGADWHFDEN